jgi:thioesterase domain-containing protein
VAVPGTREGGAETARWSCRAVENAVCALWSEQFGRVAGPHDDYFGLGGDSYVLFDFVLAARGRGLPVTASQALRNPTAARLAESVTLHAAASPPAALLAAALGAGRAGGAAAPVRPVPIVEGGAGGRLYVLHSDTHLQAERDAVASWTAWTAGPAGAEGNPADGFAPVGAGGPLPDGGLAEIAEPYLEALYARQPAGPYRLAGFGHGALLAFELAHRLRADGRDVALLALIGPPAVGAAAGPPAHGDDLLPARLAELAGRFGLAGDETLEQIHAAARRDGWYDGVAARDLPGLLAAWGRLESATREYEPAPYDGPALLVQDAAHAQRDGQTWDRALGDLQVHLVDYGTEAPDGLLRDPGVAQVVRKALEA